MNQLGTIREPLCAWLNHAVQAGASDLHIVVGYPPSIRLHGDLVELDWPKLDPDETRAILCAICPAESLAQLELRKNVDFSFTFQVNEQVVRFRANLFQSERTIGACIRIVPAFIPDFDWAGFPVDLARRLVSLHDGLVIVTGATGSGKTTTLAMLINLMNETGSYRIITVEDPIEYRFPKASNSIVTQREVGVDVHTFADGLKYGLRQDPDVILVGEIRDQETAQMALSAAETGHLVFATLHTRDAKGAITRYADLFPQEAQRDVRSQLALSLRSIVSQRLLPDMRKGEKRHLALEVLWNTYPIASAIRTGKLESIDNYLLSGRDEGMLSFDESVRQLFRAKKISPDVAKQNVRDAAELAR